MTLLAAYVDILPYTVTGCILLLLVLGVINFYSIKRLDHHPPAKPLPRVSILVPARDEAHNIEACLRSLLTQEYPDFEVLALDDHSTDATPSILAGLADRYPRLRILTGKPLPAGWLGKHWACHQLAQAATGDLILFTDADTRHTPVMLRDGVYALLAEKADMVTAFPHERTESWGERLIVPAISVFMLCFLPLAFAQRWRLPSFAFAIGQFMLFRRSAFDSVGGYGSVRGDVVDDVALARRLSRAGHRWRIMDGTRHVSCRMYRGYGEAVDGFTKNIFAYFNHRVVLFAIAWVWIEIAFVLPLLVVLAYGFGVPVGFFPERLAIVTAAAAWICWLLAYHRFGFPLALSLLYPVTISVFVWIAFRSMVLNLTGHTHWKGRGVSPSLWKW